jgi:hypothetical protein
MAKRKGTKENPVSEKEMAEVLSQETVRPYKITEAVIKDDFCNYRYEITSGLGLNDGHDVDGKGIVLDDLKNAFVKFRVHVACVDGVFRYQGIELKDIDMHHEDEFVSHYVVTGFKIYGSGDNEAIVLIGNKFSPGFSERMKVITPRIAMDNLSSYKWYNELKAAADIARQEVALYKEGKCIVVEDEEDEEGNEGKKKKYGKQLTIGSPEASVVNPEADENDDIVDELF